MALKTINQKLEEMQERGKNDLFYLATRILGFEKMTAWHKMLAEKFIAPRKKNIRLWLLPRGHFKTSLFTVSGSIYYLLNNPAERILISSAVLANSKDMVSEIGDVFIRNTTFRSLYPDYCPENVKMPTETWTKSQIELPNRKDFAKMEKSVEAHGADTSVVSRHYTRLIFDDIVAPGNFETPELRKKILQYFKACLSLKESTDTPIDLVGTRWHDQDLYSDLISKWDIELIQIPAVIDGKPIFPESFSLDALNELKRNQGSYLFSALYMLNPVPEELQLFKKDWFVYYKWIKEIDSATGYQKIQRQDDGIILSIGNRFMTVDPARTEGAGDYSAIIVNMTDEENNWYNLDMWRGQVNPMTLADKFIDMYFYWNPIVCGIETVAYQKMLKLYIEEKMRREGFAINIQELEPTTKQSKEMKIKALQPLYESRCIYHNVDHPLTPTLEEEYSRFPKGTTDDLIDAMQMQKHLIFPSSVSKVKSQDRNSLDIWKGILKKWSKNKERFFVDHQADYNRFMRR